MAKIKKNTNVVSTIDMNEFFRKKNINIPEIVFNQDQACVQQQFEAVPAALSDENNENYRTTNETFVAQQSQAETEAVPADATCVQQFEAPLSQTLSKAVHEDSDANYFTTNEKFVTHQIEAATEAVPADIFFNQNDQFVVGNNDCNYFNPNEHLAEATSVNENYVVTCNEGKLFYFIN